MHSLFRLSLAAAAAQRRRARRSLDSVERSDGSAALLLMRTDSEHIAAPGRRSEETLARRHEKSQERARWMNYGLTRMARGDYAEAERAYCGPRARPQLRIPARHMAFSRARWAIGRGGAALPAWARADARVRRSTSSSRAGSTRSDAATSDPLLRET